MDTDESDSIEERIRESLESDESDSIEEIEERILIDDPKEPNKFNDLIVDILYKWLIKN